MVDYSAVKTKAGVKADNYEAIRWAAENGDIERLIQFENLLTDEEKKEAVEAENYGAMKSAVEGGHTAILRHFIERLNAEEKNAVVQGLGYLPIYIAATNGCFETLCYLESLMSDPEKKALVQAYQYGLIRGLAESGCTDIIRHLERHLTDEEKKAAVKVEHYQAIRYAAQNGHTETIKQLESWLCPDEKKEAVQAQAYFAIVFAARDGHHATVEHFLNVDVGFAYMEAHDQEYGEKYVYPFVQQKLDELAEAREAYTQHYPHEVFDVKEEDAPLYFYLLRNLIRRGVAHDCAAAEVGTEDSLTLLLRLPAVRALAHQRINDGPENELLRLALRVENQSAAGLLMQIPEVAQAAEQNGYYQEEDLRALVRDRESSMMALNKTERDTVARVKAFYQQKMIEAGGKKKVFQGLKKDLKQRYKQNPACIRVIRSEEESQELSLPLRWSALQGLRHTLAEAEYELALKTYYQHDVHSAYRYLSKPNYWMHPEASYVYVRTDAQGEPTSERYSTFEDYIPLISLFYLAVTDRDMPALDGHTLEGRIDLFIKQLALIGRAHNWDNSRTATKAGKHINEEYDDLEADKPSCHSGVKRRLFQAVLGHKLFQRLTGEIVKQAVNEQVTAYFKQVITCENVAELKRAYDGMVLLEGDTEAQLKTLASLNISEQRCEDIIKDTLGQLEENYPGQAKDHAAIIRCLLNRHSEPCDLLRFDGRLSLYELIKQRLREAEHKTSTAHQPGLFAERRKKAAGKTDALSPEPTRKP
ncbi:MAG: hypothetical protein JJT82_00535 [Legionellaceae bacterium]|nr:hypothetical protein [Legionellaceae bacterium]